MRLFALLFVMWWYHSLYCIWTCFFKLFWFETRDES